MELNGHTSTSAAGVSLGIFPIRAAHDFATLSRRARATGEELGLQGREARRLSAAAYETARLLTPTEALEAEIRLGDGPSLQVVFRAPLSSDAQAALRSRVEPALNALRSLVHELEIRTTAEALQVCLLLQFPTGTLQRLPAAVPDLPVADVLAEDIPLDALRERYIVLQQSYRDLHAELQETNSGVVALYAELQDQADRLRQAEDRLRRRADDLAAANRAKEDFLATLSHELRTPLNAMLGWTRLLRMGKLDAEATARALETIERNARAQEQLIADILDLSRIVTGRLRFELAPTELVPIVEAALDTVRPAAEAKGLHLRSEIAFTGTVLGDANRLQQVLWNLLVNAVKFTPTEGCITLSVHDKESNVTITVADSGEGIPEDVLPFIFDRFRQGDGSATRPHAGLGLGLSIVRHIVELHGGIVHAVSAGKGKGSTFSVQLPVYRSSR